MILDHNRIGPSAGKFIGMYLKQCKTLKILNLARNRLGELDRYMTLFARERVSSAARDIFWGLKYNTNLQMLDLSYNHLGPSLAKVCPPAVCRHPNLVSFNISGNAIGDERGAAMLFALAGEAGGHVLCREQIEYYKEMKDKQEAGVENCKTYECM
jgi:Ran GTPase-activating protein (RanGAP) involved in mRNA processing and transport